MASSSTTGQKLGKEGEGAKEKKGTVGFHQLPEPARASRGTPTRRRRGDPDREPPRPAEGSEGTGPEQGGQGGRPKGWRWAGDGWEKGQKRMSTERQLRAHRRREEQDKLDQAKELRNQRLVSPTPLARKPPKPKSTYHPVP